MKKLRGMVRVMFEDEIPNKDEIPEELLYLKPNDTLNIIGKMSYKESLQAWNVIQLRKEILTIFPQLKEKRSKFGYEMFYNRSSEELKKVMDDLEKQDLTPILLMLGRIRE